jgi:carboxyl-terminal processing protease
VISAIGIAFAARFLSFCHKQIDMPERNLVIIAVAIVIGFGCFTSTTATRYSAVFGYAIDTVERRSLYEKTHQELFDAAMRGMLGSLDRNSHYYSNADYQSAHESMEQEYVGVGMVVGIDEATDRLIVVAPSPNSPAQEAGVRAGDFIIAIAGKLAEKMRPADAVSHIKGPAGEPVTITFGRGDPEKHFEIQIVRKKIYTPSIKGDTLGTDGTWDFRLASHPRIGYIRLTQFVEHSVDEMEQALESIDGKVDSIIIDLRDNLGGLLEGATKVSDMFLPPGKLIVETRGRNDQVRSQMFSMEPPLVAPEIPVVLLINGASASASEIVSACLQDHNRCVVVGQRSFGKGTVQEIIPLERKRAEMRLTTATYWRPSGQNIHRLPGAKDSDDWGVKPNRGFAVEITNEEWAQNILQRSHRDLENFTETADPSNLENLQVVPDKQLERAIEYLQSLTQGEVT